MSHTYLPKRRKPAHNRKLTLEQVVQIRNRAYFDGTPQAVLAQEYGVSQSTISKAINEVTYKEADEDARERLKATPKEAKFMKDSKELYSGWDI